MNNKKLFNLSAIILGVITLFSFNKVQATESVFDDIMPTRSNAQAYTMATFSDSQIAPIILGISQSEYKTNNGKVYWKIKDSNEIYKDIYCLNLGRGFGAPDGNITDVNNTKKYNNQYDLNNISSTQYENITGLATANKDKILWILNNSLTSKDDLSVILNAASEKVDIIDIDKQNFIKEDMKSNDRESTKLSFNDIKMVQQIALWHYTNPNSIFDNTINGICDSNGKKISDLMTENIDIDGLGFNFIRNGEVKQAKLNALYQYFIDGAESGAKESEVPSLTLSSSDAKIKESGNSYIVGPLVLTGENIALIKEILVDSNINYTLLETATSTQGVTNNDFREVINSEFYLKINKLDVNQDTGIQLNVSYKYDTRELMLLSNENDVNNTQPVVFVESKEKQKDLDIEVQIPLTDVSVEKVWEDNNNQDGIRPEEIKVQLYKDGIAYGNSITLNQSNNLKYTWTKLLSGYKYTVKELNSNGNAISNGGKYNNDYTVKYEENNNKTTITNKYIPGKVSKTVKKLWEDNNNQDGIRPEEITVKLYKLENGQEVDVDTQKLNEANNWKYTWEQLDEKLNGKNIVYGIKEISNIDGYVTTYSDETYENVDTITITNKHEIEITNEYFVRLLKVGEDGSTPLAGAWFKINGGQATLISESGKEIGNATISEEGTLNLEYSLEEVTAPEGYIKLNEIKNVKINAKVELKDNIYQITDVNMLEDVEGVTISEDNNVITIKVENEVEITGKYNVAIRKVDENGNVLTGSKFKVSGTEYDLSTGEVIIYENQQITSETPIELTYIIEETLIPVGYIGIEGTEVNIKAQVQKVDNSYKLIRATLVDSEGNSISSESISVALEGDTIVLIVENKPIDKIFDLSLRKFITKVNDQVYLREPVVDTSTIATTGTATYKHTKQPIAVQKGDIITYTIRVYNEGELDGYVDMITDHIPENLIPLIIGTEGIDEVKYADEIEFNLNWGWVNSADGKSVTTMKTAKVNSDTYSLLEGYENITDTKLDAYVEGSNKLDYIDVQIKCLVADTAKSGEYLTNIAEITDAQDINEVKGDGIDSEVSNADNSNLADYKNQEALSSTIDTYVPGQEDDDDFEKVFVKEFDLSLRKFITKVNETTYLREPVVDTSKLGTIGVNGKTITTATYKHTKEPVIVETGDLVTYKIRIYNEGTIAGFANEITDDIPEGLEFLPNSSINVSYRWKMLDAEGNETQDASKAVIIVTDYLSDIDNNNIINEVSEVDGVKTLSYKDVEVQFKVTATAKKLEDNLIINEAQISSDSDRDIDSNPNRDEKYDYETENNEDDIDYEPIKLQYFDLALRKFVTKVNSTDYNNRYPEVIYGEKDSITYKHTKDPVLVTTGDIVIYTIRVYNEGEKPGTATELTDNLPQGLEFLPDNEVNKLNGWKLIDENGNETQNILDAKKVTTNILEKEVIDGIVKKDGQKILSYKDVQIAFKVIEDNTSDKILVNTAEISNDNGDDIDSTPDNKIETEDDLDKEYVKVQYFDLALKKWVTSTKVTYDGKTTTTKTGFTEDSEGIAKVDLVASKMKKTTVKFTYNIKVINEGELPGYVYEVKDYIPSGLKFIQEDNKDWKEVKDGVVVTDKLKDTLLNPGESATVEITLTWKNSTTNLALKTNYAEISEDSGNDIDSVPDNFNKQEDDIDDAQVILSIKTAGGTTYVGLILTSVAILAAGIFLIKKYVIN